MFKNNDERDPCMSYMLHSLVFGGERNLLGILIIPQVCLLLPSNDAHNCTHANGNSVILVW